MGSEQCACALSRKRTRGCWRKILDRASHSTQRRCLKVHRVSTGPRKPVHGRFTTLLGSVVTWYSHQRGRIYALQMSHSGGYQKARRWIFKSASPSRRMPNAALFIYAATPVGEGHWLTMWLHCQIGASSLPSWSIVEIETLSDHFDRSIQDFGDRAVSTIKQFSPLIDFRRWTVIICGPAANPVEGQSPFDAFSIKFI